MTRAIAAAFAASLAIASQSPTRALDAPTPRTMSFDDRLLLNRLVVNGYDTVEVMLLARRGSWEAALAAVSETGGHVARAEREVDYLRATVPISRLTELVSLHAIESYHLVTLGGSVWYTQAVPRSRAETVRNTEVAPVLSRSATPPSDLPPVTPEEALDAGYTADDDAGVGEWHRRHPTFDGRGVTIAFLESGLIEFGQPSLQDAMALDGTRVRKIIGVLNTLDPDVDDETRVDLSRSVRARTTWQIVDGRTYIFPRPGSYTFGIFTLPVVGTLIQRFAVIRETASGQVWLDTDADADFSDERALVDINTDTDVRYLRLSSPHAADVGFVFGEGRRPDQVHIYAARSEHHSMNVSVATAHATADGLASGVAPGTRALVVRYGSTKFPFEAVVEGYIETARRPDVDILCDSTGVDHVPNAAGEFASLVFDRLLEVYGKPIFHAASNDPRFMNAASTTGGVFTVGGSLGPATFATYFGGPQLQALAVHPISAAGPSIDGAIKPDFLAPEHRISTGVWTNNGREYIPRAAPVRYLPAGYEISCCTSASSPYAAGVAALLLSAAKQTGVPYSVDALRLALTHGARFLPDWPAYQQGHGVVDVAAAWSLLQSHPTPPTIVATTETSHPLTQYRARGNTGVGIFDYTGWTIGMHRQRVIRLTRTSGPPDPVDYRVSWTGNDGTFKTASRIALPLGVPTSLVVDIVARTPDAHSALVNLHDPTTDAIVFRTQATIVATDLASPSERPQLRGSLSPLQSGHHFISVPEGVGAMLVDFDVMRGAPRATVLPPSGVYAPYFGHVRHGLGRTFTAGQYTSLWPHPAPGTWSVTVMNAGALLERNVQLLSPDNADYTARVSFLGASLRVARTPDGLAVDVRNQLAGIREPILEISAASTHTYGSETEPSGLPRLFTIDIDPGTTMLQLRLSATAVNARNLELYLYDCTSSECFLWDYTLPAGTSHAMTVRTPTPGRWVAAVNAAPTPTSRVRFTLDTMLTSGAPHRIVGRGPIATGEHWTSHVPLPANLIDARELVLELFDAAATRDALRTPWENRERVENLALRPVSIATAVWKENHHVKP